MEKYMNSDLPVEDRVDDLLSRMTLKEKAGQLNRFELYDRGTPLLNNSLRM